MTIQKVADQAGVSTATVSRMLNKNGFVSAEARKKIQQAIKETGYNPSKRKRRKSPGSAPRLKHSNVAMIWTVNQYSEQSLTGQNLMMGITEALEKIDANLTVTHIYENEDHVPALLLNGKTDGVLIHGPTPSPAICEHLKKIPTVWLLQTGSFDFGDRVKPDHACAGKIAFDYLADQECRTMCCMSYDIPAALNNYAQTRADNFLNCAEYNGIRRTLLTVPNPDNGSDDRLPARAEAAANLVEQFSRLDPRPDGLFVANELGPYIHAELLRNGIVPMKDVQLVAGDTNICSRHMLNPKPVTIRIFSKQIGKQAVETLLQRIKHPDIPQMTCSLKPQLLIPKDSGTA